MAYLRFPLLAACLLIPSCGSPGGGGGGGGSSSPSDSSRERAVQAYQRGDFERAEAEAGTVIARNPQDAEALRLIGRICLYRNRLKESVDALARAIEANRLAKVKDYSPYQDMWLALYRMDDFGRAAQYVRLLGESVLAAKFEALAKVVPYVAMWDTEPVVIPFFTTDPLPTVRLRVNGKAGLFSIDTGSQELVLDRAFAAKARTHAAGSRTEPAIGLLEEGFVDEVGAGTLFVRNVPVQIRELRPVGKTAVDGTIGTNFLMHFTFTIDYKKNRLVLYRVSTPVSRSGQELKFFIAGDRYLLARGTLDGQPAYLHLHTGLARVALASSTAGRPMNYRVSEASLGPISLKNPDQDRDLQPMISGLDTAFGFPIAASLGHEGLKGHAYTFEPERMTLTIE